MRKTVKDRSRRTPVLPTPEEDKAINAGIASDPDSPEIGDDFFKKAKPAKEFFPPEMYGALKALKRPRGRPAVENPKVMTAIRLDADVLEAFKATGRGWQTRVNTALREYVKDHSLEG